MSVSEKIYDFIGKWIIIVLGITGSVFSFLSVFGIKIYAPAAILLTIVVTGVFLAVSKLKKGIRVAIRLLILAVLVILIILFRKALVIGICYASDNVIHAYNDYFSDNILGFYDESNKILPFKKCCTILALIVVAVYSYILVIATWYKMFASIHILLSVLFVVPGLVLGKVPDSFLVSFLIIYYMLCFMYQRNKMVYPIRMALLMLVSGMIVGLIFLLSPPSKYDGEARYKTAKQKLNDISMKFKLDDFSMNNIKSLFKDNDVIANGGVSGGKLGEVGTVKYAEKLMLIVTMAPDDNIVYLKGYVGTDYTGNSWEDMSSGDAERFRHMCKEYQKQYGMDSEELESEMFTPDLMMLGIDNLSRTMKIRYEGAGREYRYIPYFSDIYLEDINYYYGMRPKTGKRLSYEYQYVSLSETEMCNAPYFYGQENLKAVSLEPMVEEFIYESECNVPDELCRLFSGLGFEQNCYNGTSASLIECISSVREYLNSNTMYTLSPGKLEKGKDYVEDFLVNKKQGYCTAYASTGVLMLRYMGIPARYVTGYVIKPGSYLTNSRGDEEVEIEVKDNSAHAWAEIYVEGLGFVPVEFTPGYAPNTGISVYGNDVTTTPNSSNPYRETTAPAVETTAPQRESTTSSRSETTTANSVTEIGGDAKAADGNGGIIAVICLTVAAILLVISLILYKLVEARRKKFDYTTEDLRHNVEILGILLVKYLGKIGIVYAKNINAGELEEKIARRLLQAEKKVENETAGRRDLSNTSEIIAILHKAKYGGNNIEITKEEYEKVRSYVEDFKNSLQYMKNKV